MKGRPFHRPSGLPLARHLSMRCDVRETSATFDSFFARPHMEV